MIRKTIAGIFAAALLTAFSAAHTQAAAPHDFPRAQKYTLQNGLQVLLHQDKAAPLVCVYLYYNVGAKDEKPGKTGFAHLFEHLMFDGSEHNNRDYFERLQKLGATYNGWTSADNTGYFQTVPRNALELVLWMESDRMGFLPPAVTQEKFNKQREVVKNEKRQRVDNQPYGQVYGAVLAAMYPPHHPYSWTPIGSLEDLERASLEDVKDFYRAYYNPNNATLCIVGDFDETEARQLVEKYFGSLPSGPKPQRVTAWQGSLTGEKRVKLYDRVQLPRMVIGWHSVPEYHPDDAPLEVLSRIMSATQASRLNRKIVYEKQLAQEVGFGHSGMKLAGRISATFAPRPGHTFEEIQPLIEEELERIKREPPSREEVRRALDNIEAGFVRGFQSVQSKAGRFLHYNESHGDPNYAAKDLERYLKVTPADVQRVAQKYLTADRLVLTVEPLPPAHAGDTALDRSKEPPLGEQPTVALPVVQKFKLGNDLEVRLVERHDLPLVHFHLVIKSGSLANPPDRAGLAGMTADLLRRGTKKRTALELDELLEPLGADVGADAGWFTTDATMQALVKHLDKSLDIFADVLLNPAFSQEELDREKKARLVGLLAARHNPGAMMRRARANVLFGDNHPYGAMSEVTEATVQALTRDDLVKFHSSHYRPNNATLIVVGDIREKELRERLEKAFAAWKPAAVPAIAAPSRVEPQSRLVVMSDRPAAAQSIVSLGAIGPPRDHEDYIPLFLANAVVGGGYMSRLNLNLRQNKGFTYGAGSGFDFRIGCSPFNAQSAVNTPVTKDSVEEMIKEFRGLVGDKPITEEELAYAKDTATRGFARQFETIGQVAGHLANMARWNLPDDYYNNHEARIRGVTLDNVQRVAKQYLDPDRMIVFVVGDRTRIEPALKELNLGEIRLVDEQGKPVSAQPAKSAND